MNSSDWESGSIEELLQDWNCCKLRTAPKYQLIYPLASRNLLSSILM